VQLERRPRGVGLELRIDTDSAVPAARIATILSSLGTAFREYAGLAGLRKRDVTLGVMTVEYGSIDIFLDAIAAAQELWKARELLGPFASHLMEAAHVLLSSSSSSDSALGRVNAADRKALAAISKPIAHGEATQINLINNGQIHLEIHGGIAADLIRATNLPIEVTSERVLRQAGRPVVSGQQVRALEAGGIEGTALFVDGQWYARLLGGFGVLVPVKIEADIAARLVHGGLYRFRGTVLRGPLGEAIGIQVSQVERID
jgi:hypothetical protein